METASPISAVGDILERSLEICGKIVCRGVRKHAFRSLSRVLGRLLRSNMILFYPAPGLPQVGRQVLRVPVCANDGLSALRDRGTGQMHRFAGIPGLTFAERVVRPFP